jgi:tetratricopeptide (TPR) repeat protein
MNTEPGKLDSLEAIQTLMKAALAELKAGRIDEAQRLAARIITECTPDDCQAFIAMSGNVWLDSVHMSGERAEVAKKLIGVGAILIGRGILADALGSFTKATELAEDLRNQNLMFPLLVLGVKGAVEAAGQTTAPPSSEPVTLDSESAIEALLEAAWNAARAGRLDEGRRLAGRLFIEVELATCARWLQKAGRLWIESVKLVPGQAAVVQRRIDAAAAFIVKEQFADALTMLEQAARFAVNAPVQHPAFPVLLMGVKGAVEDQQRLVRYKALIAKGVEAMARPGGKPEAAACFEEALVLLPSSPDTETERRLRGRLEEMLKAART